MNETLAQKGYLNRSDFLRDAVREKLEREAPDLVEPKAPEGPQEEN